jgi:hypothetical protein
VSLSLLLALIWGLAATGVAFLPWRAQFPPGIALLIAAPPLIAFLGYQHGALAAIAGLAAFVSMFRNPLVYFWRKYTGRGQTREPASAARGRSSGEAAGVTASDTGGSARAAAHEGAPHRETGFDGGGDGGGGDGGGGGGGGD